MQLYLRNSKILEVAHMWDMAKDVIAHPLARILNEL